MRGIDYLASLPEVDPKRIGCVGNSGGGTLTAYITALDPRVAAAAICCYITTLPRRMGNRIQDDPSADPEQDIFGFVGEGIDHAGLLALCAPRPTLLGTAGSISSPSKGPANRSPRRSGCTRSPAPASGSTRAEAAEKHGLTLPLREAVYAWFDRWLAGREATGRRPRRSPVTPRPAEGIARLRRRPGQRDVPVAAAAAARPGGVPKAEEAAAQAAARTAPPRPDDSRTPASTEIAGEAGTGKTLVVCVNGNETPDWREERAFLDALTRAGHAVAVVDPRGVGRCGRT